MLPLRVSTQRCQQRWQTILGMTSSTMTRMVFNLPGTQDNTKEEASVMKHESLETLATSAFRSDEDPQDRNIAHTAGRRVWGIFGNGEMDEPESTASLALASREKLDNLTFVINCNLQPATPGWSGTRQLKNHPGTRIDLRWCGLERDQGYLGCGMGRTILARQAGSTAATPNRNG